MADEDARMVLRTVYLPPELDEQLRIDSFKLRRSKNDLIRDAVRLFLAGPGGEKPTAVKREKAAAGRTRAARAQTARRRDRVVVEHSN
jgi:Arc/MetJ-type ribon-helix-helix transcriptional regulator